MAGKPGWHFRRAPNLVVYWDESGLVFHNYGTGERITAEPLACAILSFFHRWRRPEALVRHMHEYDPESVHAAVEQLARCTLLERTRTPRTARPARLSAWADWNPAAGFFHFSTRDVTYVTDPKLERKLFRKRGRQAAIPSSVKHYARAPQIPLPAPQRSGEFPAVLLRRRTWRRFSPQPVTLQQIGTLLGLSGGVQEWIRVPQLGRLALKTSPSGGARHPLELYLLALRVEGLARGLYHYAADRHRLERLRRGASAREMVRWLGGQQWFRDAAALVLMTAVLPRVQWKYDFPRAYSVVLADAGHLCQTFCLTATWLGLGPFCTMALADTKIERALGIDGVREVILYTAGVGVPPADGRPDVGAAPVRL